MYPKREDNLSTFVLKEVQPAAKEIPLTPAFQIETYFAQVVKTLKEIQVYIQLPYPKLEQSR